MQFTAPRDNLAGFAWMSDATHCCRNASHVLNETSSKITISTKADMAQIVGSLRQCAEGCASLDQCQYFSHNECRGSVPSTPAFVCVCTMCSRCELKDHSTTFGREGKRSPLVSAWVRADGGVGDTMSLVHAGEEKARETLRAHASTIGSKCTYSEEPSLPAARVDRTLARGAQQPLRLRLPETSPLPMPGTLEPPSVVCSFKADADAGLTAGVGH